jgi:N-acetylglucosamine kinase-like BadF-type ATPase
MVFRVVGEAGERGEREAQALLRSAAQDLARMTGEVIRQLDLSDEEFFLGKTGGVFVGSPYLTKEFEQQVLAMAPKVRIGSLPQSLGESAAMLACEALQTSAGHTQP